MAESFDQASLSQRENEILNLAIEGMTDKQIALRLSISTSTVNSYWVRIRGKLGHLSRTELVARALREKARADLLRLQNQSDHFEALAGLRRAEEGDLARSGMYRAILEAFPEAFAAVDEDGHILFANETLGEWFGYQPEELVGMPFDLLLTTRDASGYEANFSEYFRLPYPRRLGVAKVIYGRPKNGRLFRILLSMNGCRTSSGMVTTCVVRNLVEEIEVARRHAAAVVEELVHSPTRAEEPLRTELR